MLADNFWQRWVEELNRDKNILQIPVQMRPMRIETTPNTNAMILGTAGILAAGLALSAYLRNR